MLFPISLSILRISVLGLSQFTLSDHYQSSSFSHPREDSIFLLLYHFYSQYIQLVLVLGLLLVDQTVHFVLLSGFSSLSK